MSDTPTVDSLKEQNIQELVIYTPTGYEWVYGLSDSLIDGRAVTPQQTEDGDTELVVEMGAYYSRPASALFDDALEVVGRAQNREEAQSIVRDHMQD